MQDEAVIYNLHFDSAIPTEVSLEISGDEDFIKEISSYVLANEKEKEEIILNLRNKKKSSYDFIGSRASEYIFRNVSISSHHSWNKIVARKAKALEDNVEENILNDDELSNICMEFVKFRMDLIEAIKRPTVYIYRMDSIENINEYVENYEYT